MRSREGGARMLRRRLVGRLLITMSHTTEKRFLPVFSVERRSEDEPACHHATSPHTICSNTPSSPFHVFPPIHPLCLAFFFLFISSFLLPSSFFFHLPSAFTLFFTASTISLRRMLEYTRGRLSFLYTSGSYYFCFFFFTTEFQRPFSSSLPLSLLL